MRRNRSKINHSIIGVSSRLGENWVIDLTVMMGADFLESKEDIERNAEKRIPNIGIGPT